MNPADETPQPSAVADAAMYARVFEEHREGALILLDLESRFTRGAKLTGGLDAILQTYYCDGSRRVVEFIAKRCDQAHQPPQEDSDATR